LRGGRAGSGASRQAQRQAQVRKALSHQTDW
jgi:hypothetical protein